MKKVWMVIAILMTGIIAIGCSNKKEDKSKADSNLASSKASEHSEQEPATTKVNYTAIVKADRAVGESRLWVEELTPIDEGSEEQASMSGEVILLITDEEIISYEDPAAETIQAGQKIEVWLSKFPMATRSLPPQIAGKDVLAIRVLNAE
ncbi:hypothetical protein [Isobaculum melis]|uniref:DUF3221 domain-containing protein n=1 Tax=Isobaculum melis TaxID=142588 RepID=A0A1H9R477_9LACT|nr:hypothetical protein [Isobaculum melis]SER67417.1 hypothetical protein SAMN04488559_10341 [Isobaculum melis]